MKVALIMLFALVAVAVGASAGRRRRDSGLDFDALGANAGGFGDNVAAESGVLELEGEEGQPKMSASRASASHGVVRSSAAIVTGKVRQLDKNVNAGAKRAA